MLDGCNVRSHPLNSTAHPISHPLRDIAYLHNVVQVIKYTRDLARHTRVVRLVQAEFCSELCLRDALTSVESVVPQRHTGRVKAEGYQLVKKRLLWPRQ